MFRTISWVNYSLFVAAIICIYYCVVFVIYYSANIKNILSLPFAWLDKLSSKSQTGNRRLQSDNSNDNPISEASETRMNEAMNEDDLLPIIDYVKHQIKIILQNAANKNLIKEEVMYSMKLLLKNFLFLNNSFFLETINQYILFESSNLHSVKVTEDDLKMIWIQ